jgi:DNA-binding transcriptional MerR regulator
MVTPKQVSETLNVPGSTIRRWALRFEAVLSKQVGKKRVYTLQDVDTFRKIRDYSKQGRNLDAIEAELMLVMPRVKKADAVGLTVHPEVLRVISELNDQNVAMQLQLDKMKAQQDKQNELIAWLMLPWWKRLFRQMPGVEQQENN